MNKKFLYALFFVQVLDIFLHIRMNQFEMIRIISSLCVIGWAMIQLIPVNRVLFKLFSTVTLCVYIILNTLFIFENGIINSITLSYRIPLVVFVFLTLILMIVIIVKEIYGPKRM